tara:strand:+ start:1096 stop:1395 length:300 start_codon:yes stop_codon:yes gene_type:complete
MASALTFRKGAYYPATTQGFTSSGASQQSGALQATTNIIRIAVNQDTYIAIGTSPVATSNSLMMPAGSVEFLVVDSSYLVAFLQVTTAGRVSITELGAI